MTIHFTASTDECDTQLFRNEDDFIRFLDTMWQPHGGYNSRERNIPRIQARCLRDREPLRYPCLMLTTGERELHSGRDEIQNIFLYDLVIHEGADEVANAWTIDFADEDEAALAA